MMYPHFYVRQMAFMLLATVLVLFNHSTHAQTATGSIAGRIADQSGYALPGAQISIPTLNLKTVSNAQGEFSIPGVPVGSHTLQIDYLGYTSQTQTVSLNDGQRSNVTVSMKVGNIDEVIIKGTAIRDSTARALNQQRSAYNVTNVISSDSIGKFPDPNIAEALQRAPGIAIERDQGEGRYINVRGAPSRFSAVSVDGVTLASPSPDTRAIDLDTIPSDIVSQIEVSKSLSPEQDADSIAGAINIVTQSPFDSGGRKLSGMAGASHNDYGGNDLRGNLLLSDIFNEGKLGALVSASYSETDRQVDNVESVWQRTNITGGGEVLSLLESLFKDYNTNRKRMAITGTLDYRPTDLDRVYVRSSYAKFLDDEIRNRLGILWEEGTLEAGATDFSGTFDRPRIEKQIRHRKSRNQLSTITVGGEHERDEFTFDYAAAYSLGEQDYPHRDEILWRSSLRPDISYDFSQDPELPVISLFQTGEHLQFNSFAFRENTFRNNITDEEEFSLAGNIERPGSIAGVPAIWKFGMKWRGKDKNADEERWRDRAAGSAPSDALVNFLSDEPSVNYNYDLGFKLNEDMAKAYLASAATTSRTAATRRLSQSVTADYEVTEDIYATYGQATLEFGDTEVLVGLRVENTRVQGFAPEFNEDTGEITEGLSSKRYMDFFPGINIRHTYSDQLIARAALTRAISRPNFRDIVPRIVESDTGSLRPVYELGNPELKPAMSTNLDLGLEYYLEPLGLLSGNLFYKDLTNYHFTLSLDGSFRDGPATLVQPLNAPDGYAYGLELNWNQQFESLPDWMSGFGVAANYTYTEAEMDLGRTYAGRSEFPLAGQSKNTYNFAMFYEKYGFNARLSYTDRSDYLIDVVADDADLDLFWAGRGQLDFTSSYNVNDNWNVFVEAKNLTNSAGKRYQGSPGRPFEYEKFGYTVFGGVKFNY